MKYLFLILTVFAVACSSNSNKKSTQATHSKRVQYAEFFQIKEVNGQQVLLILSPETKKVERTIVIQANKPIQKAACLSSTHIGMMHKLNLIDRIGAISNSLYVHNPRLLQKVKAKKVLELGEETQIPVEKLISSGCQAIFYSGFGNAFPHEETLEKIGIHCLPNYDWRESHPLGKAEWIVVFGYLMGKPAQAHAIFEEVKSKYLATAAKKPSKKPIVLSGNLWSDQWNAPAGESFNAKLIEDAGGEYLYKNTLGTGSVQFSLEKILQDSKQVDYWINPGMPTKKFILQANPKLELIAPYINDKIYDYSKSGNLFWEMSAIEPHKVLEDYQQIFSGKVDKKMHFYFPVK
jgi:iron complex transport system substrate-binding protein